jgi:hypothetical protein
MAVAETELEEAVTLRSSKLSSWHRIVESETEFGKSQGGGRKHTIKLLKRFYILSLIAILYNIYRFIQAVTGESCLTDQSCLILPSCLSLFTACNFRVVSVVQSTVKWPWNIQTDAVYCTIKSFQGIVRKCSTRRCFRSRKALQCCCRDSICLRCRHDLLRAQ